MGDAQYTFADVAADHTIEAKFEKDAGEPVFYKIIATAGPGGTIEPGGVTAVLGGGSQMYVVTADPGFHIKDVLVDGSSVPLVTHN